MRSKRRSVFTVVVAVIVTVALGIGFALISALTASASELDASELDSSEHTTSALPADDTGDTAAPPAAQSPSADPAPVPASDPTPATTPAPATEPAPATDAPPAAQITAARTIDFAGYSGGTTVSAPAGRTAEAGFTVRNNGTVGISANSARLHFRAEGDATFTTGTIRYVSASGTRYPVCALAADGSAIDCLTTSNMFAIQSSSSAARYGNFYATYQLSGASIPGSVSSVSMSFDFDPAVYSNVGAPTSTTWNYQTAVPAPAITASADAVAPSAPIGGTGYPGAELVLSDSEGELGRVAVADDGTWSLAPSRPLADGITTVSAVQWNLGAASPAATADITVDASLEQIVDPGDPETPGDGTALPGQGVGDDVATPVDAAADGRPTAATAPVVARTASGADRPAALAQTGVGQHAGSLTLVAFAAVALGFAALVVGRRARAGRGLSR
ncbi:hypothetical protein [Schumannella soli]|uniref:Uncharacterized protein n=1 Tax=Schumannella soli TaxID=2590779 RepID=A0A506XV88_9MICO|nr:hypothetical protein [Schumannella soli]TPW74066.1 hypothetical protein FJ657_15585 [Schumannella soli]